MHGNYFLSTNQMKLFFNENHFISRLGEEQSTNLYNRNLFGLDLNNEYCKSNEKNRWICHVQYGDALLMGGNRKTL